MKTPETYCKKIFLKILCVRPFISPIDTLNSAFSQWKFTFPSWWLIVRPCCVHFTRTGSLWSCMPLRSYYKEENNQQCITGGSPNRNRIRDPDRDGDQSFLLSSSSGYSGLGLGRLPPGLVRGLDVYGVSNVKRVTERDWSTDWGSITKPERGVTRQDF